MPRIEAVAQAEAVQGPSALGADAKPAQGVRVDRTAEGPVLAVQVVPRARRVGVVGRHGDALKLAVQAPPVDGAANVEVLSSLAAWAGVPKSAVRLVTGQTARRKRVLFSTLSPAALEALLAAELEEKP